ARNCLTTGKWTSAASSARRMSRSAASTWPSLRVPWPRRDRNTPWSFSPSASNKETPPPRASRAQAPVVRDGRSDTPAQAKREVTFEFRSKPLACQTLKPTRTAAYAVSEGLRDREQAGHAVLPVAPAPGEDPAE